jgi:hypothetical protein
MSPVTALVFEMAVAIAEMLIHVLAESSCEMTAALSEFVTEYGIYFPASSKCSLDSRDSIFSWIWSIAP